MKESQRFARFKRNEGAGKSDAELFEAWKTAEKAAEQKRDHSQLRP